MTTTPTRATETTTPIDLDDGPALEALLDRLARAPSLLVASDYDGTLAPIVENPADAKPDRESIVAVELLADLPQTHAAIISGRSLADLADLTGSPRHVRLVGSHGSEFDQDFVRGLSEPQRALRERVSEALSSIAATAPGLAIETKPASIALHYRNAERGAGERAASEAVEGPGSWEGVRVKRGKMVVELAVVDANKGSALAWIRQRVGASAALFVGDDVTDEDAFATLAGPDVGIKVGEGETRAGYRVRETRDVARLLAQLAERRAAWCAGAHAEPIESHSMLTDQRTIGLVTASGRLVYMCLPRIDSPALFAEMLGGPSAGYYAVAPAENRGAPKQAYVDSSFHVRTAWRGLEVTDYLDCSGNRPFQRAGRTDLIRVIEGSGPVRIEFAPRMDFGRQPTRLRLHEHGLEVEDTPDPIVLRSPGVDWTLREDGPHHTACAEITLDGGPLVLELRYGSGSVAPSVVTESQRRRQTERYWRQWADGLDLPDVETELCRRSALVLRGLVYGPTGAIAAAGTTSLPETLGGVRNWDYRYCWPRDASMAAAALVRLGSTAEAMRLMDWLLAIVDTLPSPDRLHPIYTVTGHELGAEAEIGELAGYAGSRPVRVGNQAARQLQMDVFGPIVELVHVMAEVGAPLSGEHWRLVEAAVSAVQRRWEEPDHGIWEVRGPRKHYTHSKAMCWLAVDRGVDIARELLGREREDWIELRDRIAADIAEHGYHDGVGAYTMAYGEEDLDAATLTIGLSGLVNGKDGRFASTVEAVQRGLRLGPGVYRYRTDDNLPGDEGGFHLCTGWLIESLAMVGREDDAWSLFRSFTELAGPTGLFSEEWCPKQSVALGNHPQAYSHLAFINAALRLSGRIGG